GEFYQQQLAIAQAISNPKQEMIALIGLGQVNYALDNYRKAIEYYERGLIIARNIRSPQDETAILGNLGLPYFELGDYSKAIGYYQQQLQLARSIQSPSSEMAALTNLGIFYSSQGDYGKAIDYYQQSLALARQIKYRKGQVSALGNLGRLYNNIGDYNEAIKYLQQQLVISRELKDRQGESTALGNLGAAYLALGDNKQALESYRQFLTIAQEIKDLQGEALALGGLGDVSLALGDYNQAIKFYEQSLAIERQTQNRVHKGGIFASLGNAYIASGDYDRAIEFYTQSLQLSQKQKDREVQGISLNNLGISFLKLGKLVEAEKNLLAAIEIWESIRTDLGNKDSEKISIFEQQARSYRSLQEVLVAQNRTSAALEVAERGRARAFFDLLTRRLNPPSEAKPTITYPTLEDIKKIAKAQEATLVQYSIIYEDSKESALYIWVIKPTGEEVFRQVDLKSLRQQNKSLINLIPRIRRGINVRGANTNEPLFKPGDRIHFKGDTANSEPWEVVSFDTQNGILRVRLPSFTEGVTIPKSINDVEDFGQTSLQQLHQILIQPIADLLPTNPSDRVIFIPQAELFLVPFPALQDANGDYLIKKHTILTAPSIQVLESTHKLRHSQQISPNAPVLVVGNPSPMPNQYSPLPYAEKEATDIASLFNTKAIIGTQATETSIVAQMSNARVIHLATHGEFDNMRGLGSAIALAPSDKDNGLLTAEEILNLKLNAELVVLSACDTGRGRLTGDGVIGLSRSLIAAGVPSVVVSLWKVPDDTTAGLMSEFYRQ
ncbi:CHAT domain-containing protein, partial [Planktothrix sp. FACHB-1355]